MLNNRNTSTSFEFSTPSTMYLMNQIDQLLNITHNVSNSDVIIQDNMNNTLYWDYPSDDMICNVTCCTYLDNDEINVICFNDKNFTDNQALTYTPTWNLVLRWGLIVPPLVLLGVLGNLAIILILITNRLLMKTSVNQFILNMAVSDLILAITGPITFTIRDTHQFWVLGHVWCHLDGFIQVTVMLVSVITLSTISIDRLLGILHPMHTHLKIWQSIVIIVVIWFFSALCAVPFYIYRVYGVREWSDITEVYCDEITDKTAIYWLLIIIVLNWIPLTIMIFCYTKLFWTFKKHALKVEGKEHPGIFKMKKKFIKMLFIMIIAFAACWLPFQMFIIYREKIIMADHSTVNSDQKLYKIFFTITQYLIYLNPVVSPFIYGLMHENFKKGFRVTFSCFFKEKPEFVLMQSFGNQSYVWNKQSRFRHTISSTGYNLRQNRANSQQNRDPLCQNRDTNIDLRKKLYKDNIDRRKNNLGIKKKMNIEHSKQPSNTDESNVRIKISFIDDTSEINSVVDVTESRQRSIISYEKHRRNPILDAQKLRTIPTAEIDQSRLNPITKWNMRCHSPVFGNAKRPQLKRSTSAAW